MNKIIKVALEAVFNLVYPVLQPVFVQRILRTLGFRFPYYRFAEKLKYTGLVDFKVNDTELLMQSYNTPIDMFIFWYGIFGYWESTQLQLWSRLVMQSGVILDVGANSGVYSLIASTNKKAKVHAFEPVPVVREMLARNASLNKDATINISSSLVGDKVGNETLYVPRSGWVDVASVDKVFAERFAKPNELVEVLCPMTTIDEYLSDLKIGADEVVLAKIDVEGAEERVLQGMINTLKYKTFVFTAELLTESIFNNFVKSLPATYQCHAIDEQKKSVYPIGQYEELVTNYLFVPNNFDLPL
jgi:FkbM family methyltransferase